MIVTACGVCWQTELLLLLWKEAFQRTTLLLHQQVGRSGIMFMPSQAIFVC